MNAVKGKYIGVCQQMKDTNDELSNIKKELVAIEAKLDECQQHLERKARDYDMMESKFNELQKEYQESKVRATNNETQNNSVHNNLSTEIAKCSEELRLSQ